MFEKEAEEYASGKGHEHYNYLFEENAGTPATFANWCFKDGAEFGYNKANEWKYPSKGEYPKDYSEVNVAYYDSILVGTKPRGLNARMAIYINKEWMTDCNEILGRPLPLDKRYVVVAWKEIVLPELRESE